MSDGEEGTPMKHPKPASSVEEAPITTTPFPDLLSSMQAYYGGAAPAAFYASTVGSPSPHPYMWRNQHRFILPYGIPMQYPALFLPGGIFTHPIVPTDPNLAPTSGEVGRKISDEKGRTSAKKSIGVSGSTSFAVDKGAENQKAASSSDNDCPSLSSENGVDGSLEVRSNPLDVAAPGAIVVHDGMLPDQRVNDERELKRQRRKQSNRESARRSRLRKQAKSDELQERLDNLSKENRILRKNLQRISEACAEVTSENHSIKEELLRNYGPDGLTRLPRNLQEAAGELLIEDDTDGET
uniref:Light-inducible protein CPRF3 n=1 Tax=Petroselinum crispum TaxID=4043 RepID=CPRF3_PETCR|nr:RecName: Full=Light-inducible protein CPRF3; AltName: Full=Common plant regulatory factor 3; Short=CPRF-3 [Petroselinum crispum]CAA41452.1 light-inducible protein CPRF-3 [Petroselinum crispum]